MRAITGVRKPAADVDRASDGQQEDAHSDREESQRRPQAVDLPAEFGWDHRHCRGDQDEGHDGDGGQREDEGHAAPEAGPGPVGPHADQGQEEEGGDVVQRHDHAGHACAQAKPSLPGRIERRAACLQIDRHVGVVECPHHADAEKAKADEQRFLVVQASIQDVLSLSSGS